MEQNRLSIIKKIKNQLNLLSKFPFLSLLLIGIGAITIRLIFFQNELIFNSDNLLYFKHSIDLSKIGESSINLQNDGWPQLLSLFFRLFDSENFLHYMNLQSYLTISFSVLTIIPLYFFARKFVNSSLAIISTIFFVFEPRIIQNSLIGTTDPLFILLIVTSLALVIQKSKYLILISFITIAFASLVRVEGLFLIPALCVMFFLRFKISKKNIFYCIIFLSITILILLPFSMQRIENSENDYLVSRIISTSSSFSEQTQNDPNQILLKIGNSIYLLGGFLAKLMIPYLIIFIPIGLIMFLKKNNIQKLLLIVPLLFLILPILYAYTIPALDGRYLFTILPIMCIIGAFSGMKYFQNAKYKKLILVVIIITVIFSSILFLIYKNNEIGDQKEFLELANIINKNTDIILYSPTPILSYLEPARLLELKEFPVMSSNYVVSSVYIKGFESYSNIEDFFLLMEKNGITHMVYDEEIDNPIIFKKIFGNYEEYENLKKIFDSQENGFNYKIKIFEIKY